MSEITAILERQRNRPPPHDLAAERAALGSCLIRPLALDDLADLEVDDFFLPQHREIIEAMRAVVRRNRALDVVTLADELKARQMLSRLEGGEEYLLRLSNETPASDNVRHYVRIVSDKAMMRKLIATCAETMQIAYGDVSDADELIAEVRARVGALEVRGRGGPVMIGDRIDAVIDELELRGQAPEKYLLPSGIGAFDESIGGFRADQLVVIAANPGKGKTALALNIAVRAAKAGIPMLVFSLEMSTPQLIERALAYEARVNGFSVSMGKMSGPEWIRLESARQKLRSIPLWIEPRKLSAQRICSEARRWRARLRSPRAGIVIDYLGLVKNEHEGETRAREVGEMSRSFKLLAGEDQANAPVILCAQLNRENMRTGKDGKPRPPMISDLRDSGEIEQDADMIVFPWYEGDPPPHGRYPAELRVAKHRGGRRGEIPVDWEPEFTTFSDREDYDRREPNQGNLL